MFDRYNVSTIEKLSRKDEIASAEKVHLIKEITNQDAQTGKQQQHILAILGVKLVDWGYRLQSRYDELVNVNVGPDIHGSPSNPC